MNNQHLIDNAIFDTTYSEKVVAYDRRSEIDDFVKNNLLKVIDKVFDKVDRDSGNPDSVFRIDRLEIDLGNIPYRDFRQQMPRKLHEQLLLALREVRYPATKKPLSSSSMVDSKSAAQTPLFYFLRNGYLPWYSRLTDPNALESLLIETIDTTPATLIEFMRDKVQRARVLERLTKQFSEPTVQRVMGLLPSLGNPENDRAAKVDNMEEKMVSALLTGDAALIESAWRAIYAEHSQLLKKILRHYGQQAIVRHNIAASFSPARFSELLRLLEPAAHDFVQLLLDHAVIFQSVDEQKATVRSRQIIELREFTLAYLLLERGSRFSRKSCLGSLIRQMSASSNRSQSLLLARVMENTGRSTRSNKLAGDVSQLLRGVAAEMTAEMARYKGLPLSDVAAQMASDKDLPLSDVTAQTASDKDLPLSDVTAQVASDKDLPLSDVTAQMASDKDLPLSDVTAQMASDKDSLSSEAKNQAGPHEQYERVRSTLALAGADREYRDSSLHEDIKILTRDAPHLLMRLFSELQTGSHAWRQAIETLSIPVLAELSYAYLSSNKQTDLAVSSDPGSDLLSAIHSNAEKSQDKQAFFIHILSCLIKDEVIDFNAIRSDASYEVIPAATASVRGHSVHKADHPLDNATGSVSSTTSDASEPDQVQSEEPASLENIYTANSVHIADHPLDNAPGSVSTTAIDASETDQVQSEEPAPLENIYIANAGAVLLAPYLPRLFERLGLLDKGKFKNRDAAEHGVHCVQFLVNESISSPEYQLVLNKLLCGVKPGLPVRRSIELVTDEKEQLEALLHAITQHWKPLANTSIAGLRESFLQRNGSLQLKSDAWHLSVEARPFDMLLDQIPWSYSTIKFPWMDRVIYVEWR